MKFIVVDDNETFLDGLVFFIENVLNYKVIARAHNGNEFLSLPNIFEADIILMDIEMPDLNGIETVQKALWDHARLNFIAVTSYTEKTYLKDLISAGFKSCVFKSKIYDELSDAVKAVKAGMLYFPGDMKINN